MKAKIKVGGETIEIEDIVERKGFSKAIGLMFSKQETARAMLFRFNKETKTPIHSFFCPEFLAVWMKNGNVIETRVVNKRNFSIKPKEKFDTLIEIPFNKRYEKAINFFKNKNFPS